jgi:hypothetical protein
MNEEEILLGCIYALAVLKVSKCMEYKIHIIAFE